MSRRQRKGNLSEDRRRRQQTTASNRPNPTDAARTSGGPFAQQTTARGVGGNGWLIMAALVVAVFLAYQPVWCGGFVWDDDLHLVNNPVLKTDGLLQAWVPGSYINYWPLTFTVYRLEFEMWGLNPARLPPGEHRAARPFGDLGVEDIGVRADARGDVGGRDLRAASGERRKRRVDRRS